MNLFRRSIGKKHHGMFDAWQNPWICRNQPVRFDAVPHDADQQAWFTPITGQIMKMNILITGATGNIGREVIEHFAPASGQKIVATVQKFRENEFTKPVERRIFDFHDSKTIRTALHGIDIVFLLRPPSIADIKNVFKPLVEMLKAAWIKHVVFLSVQGAENNPLIPHYKIEKLLRESGIPYTFIRPGYFMQNLTTTLHKDVQRGEIYLSAVKAKFNWVDAADIGRAIAVVLAQPETHDCKRYVITGREQLDFEKLAEKIARITGKPMRFKSPSWPSFFLTKMHQGERIPMIFVLMAMHFLPRFLKSPLLSNDYQMLTGRQPGTLKDFIKRKMMGI